MNSGMGLEIHIDTESFGNLLICRGSVDAEHFLFAKYVLQNLSENLMETFYIIILMMSWFTFLREIFKG